MPAIAAIMMREMVNFDFTLLCYKRSLAIGAIAAATQSPRDFRDISEMAARIDSKRHAVIFPPHTRVAKARGLSLKGHILNEVAGPLRQRDLVMHG